MWYRWPTKGVKPYFQQRPLSEILTIANHWHTASRIWTCVEPEFRLSWLKLCSNDNRYTTAPGRLVSSLYSIVRQAYGGAHLGPMVVPKTWLNILESNKLLFFKINLMESIMNSFVNHTGIKFRFLVIQ